MLELEGRLIYAPKSGYLLLTVPNDLAIGAYRALNIGGVELPTFGDDPKFNAHITVMRPGELQSIGGWQRMAERGKSFRYRITGIDSSTSSGDKYSRYYYFQVAAPELVKLRRSYGLSGSPVVPFHITFAARRRNVLRENSVRKVAAYGPISEIAARSMCLHWPSQSNLR